MKVLLVLPLLILLSGCTGVPVNTARINDGINNAFVTGLNSIPQPQSTQTYDATITRLYGQSLIGYGSDSTPWTVMQGNTFRLAPLVGATY